MIELIEGGGDIFNGIIPQALVNPVNCVGVMGAGLALQFKGEYPENFWSYKHACDRKEIKLGSMFIHDLGADVYLRYIINFPTKQHWRDNSPLWAIRVGLIDLVDRVKQLQINSISIPPIGCGLGGLSWDVVKPKIFQAFERVSNIDVYIFEPIFEYSQISLLIE